MKFIFDKEEDAVKRLDPMRGEFDTDGRMNAKVSYLFDNGDATVRVGLDNQWLGDDDIDVLIEFLQAAKANLKK